MSQQQAPLSFNDVVHLFHVCGHLQRHLQRGFVDHHDLTFEEVQVLWRVQSTQGDARTSTAVGIGEALVLRGDTKKLIAKLKKAGFVEEDPESPWRDNRRKPLRLTKKGAIELGRFQATWDAISKQASLESLDQESLRNLSVALRGLLQAPDVMRRAFKHTDGASME